MLQSTCGPRCDGTTSLTSVRITKKRASAASEVSGSCLQLNVCSRGIQRDLVQLIVPCLWHADVHLVPYRHLFAELARGAVAELFCITFTSLEAVGGMGFPDPYPTSHVDQCWICHCGIQGTVLVVCQS